jgi:hypothetical protein
MVLCFCPVLEEQVMKMMYIWILCGDIGLVRQGIKIHHMTLVIYQ